MPEDIYSQNRLGELASAPVVSFPGDTIRPKVVRIADQAEYTPCNVQTQDDRHTADFEIDLKVEDHSGKLKPGTPADVRFQ